MLHCPSPVVGLYLNAAEICMFLISWPAQSVFKITELFGG